MSKAAKSAPGGSNAKRRIRLERTFDPPLEDVWELWTTKAGIESWWGPENFSTEVHELDLRPGGRMVYTMNAIGAAEVAFMRREGLPVATQGRLTYTEIVRHQRLAYEHDVDFVPGVGAYKNTTTVELSAEPTRVRMVLTLDAMHDAEWTERTVAGWESSLRKLAAAAKRNTR